MPTKEQPAEVERPHEPGPYCPVCHCFGEHGIRCGDGWVGEPIEKRP